MLAAQGYKGNWTPWILNTQAPGVAARDALPRFSVFGPQVAAAGSEAALCRLQEPLAAQLLARAPKRGLQCRPPGIFTQPGRSVKPKYFSAKVVSDPLVS